MATVARRVATGLAAGVAAGLLAGAVARVMMRLVALSSGDTVEFSLAATAVILLVFVVPVLPGALLAALWRGRGRSLLLVIGTALLLVLASGFLVGDLGELEGLSGWRWAGVVTGAAGVYAAVVASPLLVLRLLRRPAG